MRRRRECNLNEDILGVDVAGRIAYVKSNTRAVYGRAAGTFLRWCEAREIADLRGVRAVHVAAYVKSKA